WRAPGQRRAILSNPPCNPPRSSYFGTSSAQFQHHCEKTNTGARLGSHNPPALEAVAHDPTRRPRFFVGIAAETIWKTAFAQTVSSKSYFSYLLCRRGRRPKADALFYDVAHKLQQRE